MVSQLFDVFYTSSGICTDTRAIQPNSLFICIKGENFDGNTFASKALENGACHVIVDNEEFYDASKNMTFVKDSVKYLQNLANFHRNKFNIPVIGITGSNGKTTTKELINAVLSKKYNVLATQGNLNNHLGVPFTLLQLKKEHDIAIIEMGANKFKDIEELCQIAQPNYGIITNIGKAHLEGFIDFNGVLKTKKELYDAISAVNGTISNNSDDLILQSILPTNTSNFSYGTSEKSIINGELVCLSPFVELKWSAETYQSTVLKTKMVGKYNFYNYLAAISFGFIFKVENELISEAISSYEPTNRRSQVKDTDSNTLILDCYNANPTSMESALESFANNTTPLHKLVIIGQMGELGNDSESEHKKIVELTKKLNLEGYFVGEKYAQYKSESIIEHFNTTNELIDYLQKNPLTDNLILLKGSRSVGLEKSEDSL